MLKKVHAIFEKRLIAFAVFFVFCTPNPQDHPTSITENENDQINGTYQHLSRSSNSLGPSNNKPVINVPIFDNDIRFNETAIFWFGKVNVTDNYADVRIGYNNEKLYLHIAIFDKWLWYNESSDGSNLTAWDAVSLYLGLNGVGNASLTENDYWFVGQLNHWQPRQNYEAVHQGNASGWQSATIDSVTESGWRGNGFKTAEARGWTMRFHIRFSDLGLSGPPSQGTVWRLGLVVHDRDDQAATPIENKKWPDQSLETERSDTWGQMRFGYPAYVPPSSTPAETIVVQDCTAVKDIAVGGGAICGEDAREPDDFFGLWGDFTRGTADHQPFHIQNQADVADWPCFSKGYLTFPLDSLPLQRAILAATLRMYHWGGSDPANAESSHIQILEVTDEWDKTTITWNNAPQVQENFQGAWVPVIDFPGWHNADAYRYWDVTRAVAKAYAAGHAFRIAMYESDGAYHSGKHFVSSLTGDWNAEARPRLEVVFSKTTTGILK